LNGLTVFFVFLLILACDLCSTDFMILLHNISLHIVSFAELHVAMCCRNVVLSPVR